MDEQLQKNKPAKQKKGPAKKGPLSVKWEKIPIT
jgi:hypothetical protein